MEMIWLHHEDNNNGCNLGSLPLEEAWEIQITPALFERLLKRKRFQEILKDLEIAEMEQVDLFETLDVDGGGTLDLEELVQGIAKLRGDARRSDVVSVGLMVRAMMESFTMFQETVAKQLEAHAAAIGTVQGALNVDYSNGR